LNRSGIIRLAIADGLGMQRESDQRKEKKA
jgi:hypothetical protein